MHFGDNCELLLPFRDKCRKLADSYKKRGELIEEKWVSLQDAIIYLDLPLGKMVEHLKNGNIKMKRKKNGEIIFGITAAWEYDECPLANSGGQCFYFAPHNSEKITCLAERVNMKTSHPNIRLIPDSKKILKYQQEIIEIMGC